MANSDDISGMRYEISGSGPQGQGGKQNYIDPSLTPKVMSTENEHRLVQQSGTAAAKFFGIIAGFAGLALGGISKLLFREGIPNGWKMSGKLGLAGLGLGGVVGYFVGKDVMKKNLRNLHKAQAEMQVQAQSEAEALPVTPKALPLEETQVAPAVLQQAAPAELKLVETKHDHTQGDCPACATGKIARGDTLGELADANPATTVSHIKEHAGHVKDDTAEIAL